MFYAVIYSKKAKKFMNANKLYGLRFMQTFTEISEDISKANDYDVIKIAGYDHMYRLRIGKYRALFNVKDEKLLIIVVDIDSRGDIYKSI